MNIKKEEKKIATEKIEEKQPESPELNKETKIIAVKPDSNVAFLGDTEVLMEVNAEVKNQRIMVPLRFIMDHLGKNVEWDQDTGTVKIN